MELEMHALRLAAHASCVPRRAPPRSTTCTWYCRVHLLQPTAPHASARDPTACPDQARLGAK
eukprot:4404829-Prymnesium_polylepis.1